MPPSREADPGRRSRRRPRTAEGFRPVTAALVEHADDTAVAFSGPGGTRTWRQLADHARHIAGRLLADGLAPGDRVALLVPPSADCLAAAYGIWMAGGVVVAVDSQLGLRPMRRLLRGATVQWSIGTDKTVRLARALGLTPGATHLVVPAAPIGGPAFTASTAALPVLDPAALAAVVHTSGATGPAKPVALHPRRPGRPARHHPRAVPDRGVHHLVRPVHARRPRPRPGVQPPRRRHARRPRLRRLRRGVGRGRHHHRLAVARRRPAHRRHRRRPHRPHGAGDAGRRPGAARPRRGHGRRHRRRRARPLRHDRGAAPHRRHHAVGHRTARRHLHRTPPRRRRGRDRRARAGHGAGARSSCRRRGCAPATTGGGR